MFLSELNHCYGTPCYASDLKKYIRVFFDKKVISGGVHLTNDINYEFSEIVKIHKLH